MSRYVYVLTCVECRDAVRVTGVSHDGDRWVSGDGSDICDM